MVNGIMVMKQNRSAMDLIANAYIAPSIDGEYSIMGDKVVGHPTVLGIYKNETIAKKVLEDLFFLGSCKGYFGMPKKDCMTTTQPTLEKETAK
jgi:hypothetical protein